MSALSSAFERLLPVVERDLRTILGARDDFPSAYYHMIHYHMGWVNEAGEAIESGRGKRIRPGLALLVSEATCGRAGPARPAAAAVEVIHNFSLLHDDIQDRSPTRRGRPAAWTVWNERQAINAGDAMFALAHLAIQYLAPEEADPTLIGPMLRILDETSLHLTRGQHLDMAFESRSDVTVDEYLNMIRGKTAALIAAAAHMGALAGGVDTTTQAHYHDFGLNLGLAFQVRDDILDIWGKPEDIGKEAAVDIRDRKKSLPILYGLEHSDALCELYYSDQVLDDARVAEAIRLLDSVDARGYAASLAGEYSEATVDHLQAANPQGEAGEALYELIEMLLHRAS
jgi:geranylgeranyl diphosphate synthase type I